MARRWWDNSALREAVALNTGVGVPSNAIIAFAGDSRTAQAFDATTGRFFLESRGPAAWALPNTGSRFIITSPNQYGVSGDTTALLLARWAAVLADPAATIALMIGVNDRRNNQALQQSKDNVTAMLDAAYLAGKWVLLSDEMPLTDPGLVAGQLQNHVDFHTWLALQAATRSRVRLWASWNSIVDPATIGTTWAPLSGTMLDQSGVLLHPLTKGAKLAGAALATAIQSLLPANDYSRPYLPGESAAKPVLNANPDMAGIVGSKGSGITGDLATNYTAVFNAAATGISCACTKETIGGIEYQVFTFSGTGGAGAPQFTLRPTTDLVLGAAASFDVRCKTILSASASNTLSVQPQAIVNATSGQTGNPLDGYQSPDNVPAEGFDLHLCSPPVTVPASGVTSVRGQFVIVFVPSVAVSAVVKIARFAVRETA